MKKLIIPILLICLTVISIIIFELIRNKPNSLASENQKNSTDNKLEEKSNLSNQEIKASFSNENIESKKQKKQIIQIEIIDIDGKGKNYKFEYNDEIYKASYTKDNWHITDSFKIKDKEAITKICEKLIEIHPIHGKDLKSYRTVEDLVYEWEQHNIAYELLPEDSSWKKSAKNVDLDSKDQGKSLVEMFNIRTNKKMK